MGITGNVSGSGKPKSNSGFNGCLGGVSKSATALLNANNPIPSVSLSNANNPIPNVSLLNVNNPMPAASLLNANNLIPSVSY